MKTIIKNKDLGQRLDKFLGAYFPENSRSQIQKMIKNDLISVNGKKTTAGKELKLNDIVEIKKEKTVIIKKEDKKTNKVPKHKTVAETSDYLIVNKPAGLITHGDKHIQETSLADLLLKKYPFLSSVGEDEYRPGIVHRLDKEAGGLMVVAKNNKMYKHLKKQFQNRLIKKTYQALVFGQIEKDEDQINFPIKRSSLGHKMAAIPLLSKNKSYQKEFPHAKEAETEFVVLKKFINYTLLEVKIKTGRTHQIRCHLTAYGHPLVGDNLYATKKTKDLNKKVALNRIFLMATKLSFLDLEKKEQTFKANLSKELKDFLKICR